MKKYVAQVYFLDFADKIEYRASRKPSVFLEEKIKKENKKDKKGVDKIEKMWYNKPCEPNRSAKSLSVLPCRCGGTGRRPGLKIP